MAQGCTDTFSKTINITESLGLNEVKQMSNLIIYPNPVTTVLNVKKDLQNKAAYKIVSITGQEIQTGIIDNTEKQISVYTLSDGVYFLQLFDKNISIGQQKFVKISK
jgi:hypothetical protein